MKSIYRRVLKNIDQCLLVVLVFLIPFERIPSFDFGGVTLRLSFVLAGLIIVRAAWVTIWERSFAWVNNFTPISLLAFLAWVALTSLLSIDLYRGIQVVVFTWFTSITALSVLVIYKKEYLEWVFRSLIFSATLVALFGVYQYLGNFFGIPDVWTGIRDRYSWQVFGFPRIQSVALEPLYYASYLLIPTMVIYAKILMRDTNGKKLYALGILLTTSIFLTVSRGGIAALVGASVVLVGYLTVLRKTYLRRVLTVGFTIALGFFLSLLVTTYLAKPPADQSITGGKKGGEAYTEQLQNTGLEGGGDERAETRRQALQLLQADKSRYVVGIGAGQFGPYVQGDAGGAGGWFIVNNQTIEMLLEYGAIGVVLFSMFIGSLFLQTHHYIRGSKDGFSTVVATGLLAYLFATAIQYQTFSTLYIMHIWVAIGLMMAIVLGDNSREGSNEKKAKPKKAKS